MNQQENVPTSHSVSKNLISKKFIIIVLIAISLITALTLWYFLYYVKTPTYSLNLIQKAVKKHDLVSFKKHVDLENVLNHGYDDFMDSYMDEELSEEDSLANSMAQGFVAMFKKPLIDAMKDSIYEYVETGDFENKKADDEDEVISPKEVMTKTGFNNSKIKKVKSSKINGNVANVEINIYDEKLDKDFVITLKMNKLENNEWQVSQIIDLKNFIKENTEATQAKLQELNKPIKEKINASVAVKNSKFKVVANDDFGFDCSLKGNITLDIKSAKQITYLEGILITKKQNGKKLTENNFNIKSELLEGKSPTVGVSFELNPFIPEQDELINTNNFVTEIVFTNIKFNDGTSEKILTEIP